MAGKVVVPLPGSAHFGVLAHAGEVLLHHGVHRGAEGFHVLLGDEGGIQKVEMPGRREGGAAITHVKGPSRKRHLRGEATVDEVVVVFVGVIVFVGVLVGV